MVSLQTVLVYGLLYFHGKKVQNLGRVYLIPLPCLPSLINIYVLSLNIRNKALLITLKNIVHDSLFNYNIWLNIVKNRVFKATTIYLYRSVMCVCVIVFRFVSQISKTVFKKCTLLGRMTNEFSYYLLKKMSRHNVII